MPLLLGLLTPCYISLPQTILEHADIIECVQIAL